MTDPVLPALEAIRANSTCRRFSALPSLCKKRITIESMAHRVLLGPSAVCGAGFALRALEDLSLGEHRLVTWDELEQETFAWTLAEQLDAEPNLEGCSTPTVWEVVEAIAETNSVEVIR
jgi:hypothetical protein